MMKIEMRRWGVGILVLFTFWLLPGCQPQKMTDKGVRKSLPSRFLAEGLANDTMALPRWRTYFADSGLVQLIDKALNENFELKEVRQRVELFRSQLILNRGIRMPDLNLAAGSGLRRYGEYTMDGVGNFDTRKSPNINEKQMIPNPLPDFSIGFMSSWEIDLWGKLKQRKKAAQLRFQASEQAAHLATTLLISELASAWYELQNLSMEMEIIQENYNLQSKAFEVVNIQKQGGMANQLAVEIMEAQMLSSQERRVEIEQRKLELENAIHYLLGRFPEPIAIPRNFLSRKLFDSLQAGIPSRLLRNRPDIMQAEKGLEAAKADVASARLAFYPSLNIAASLGLQAFKAELLWETPASIAFQTLGGLTTPLLNRRILKSQLMQAEAEKRIAYIQYEKTLVRAFTEVYNCLKNIENTEKMYNIKSQEVKVLLQSTITSSDLFRTGRATYLEIVNAQKNALQAQLELSNLKKRQFQARIDLYRALGGGWQ